MSPTCRRHTQLSKLLNKYFATSFTNVGVLQTNCRGGLEMAFKVVALRRSIIRFPGLYSSSGISLTYQILSVAGSNSMKVMSHNPSSYVHIVHAKLHVANLLDIRSI